MVSHCACPTRVFRDRAVHEHRRASSLPSTSFSSLTWSILGCAQLSHPPTQWQIFFTHPTLRLLRNRFPETYH